MDEKKLRSVIFQWYREALCGDPSFLTMVCDAVETFYCLELIPESIYELTIYCQEDLRHLQGVGNLPALSPLQPQPPAGMGSGVLPFV